MKKILIVTGGSGGHVFPAISIYDHLYENFDTSIVTDIRGSRFINQDKYEFNLIDVPNLFSKLYLFPVNLIKFLYSIIKSFFYLKKNNIDILISTGGYMSIPLCLAAKIFNKKILLLEPNSVLGRANKLILKISSRIICYDENLRLFPKKYNSKIYLIDRILRKEIYFSQKNKSKEFKTLKKILVLGGSQGAKFFDKNICNLLINISKKLNLEVCQQVFDKDERVLLERKYNEAGIKFKLFEFDENISKIMHNYDLAITRSGSNSISELAYLNVPFLAIPFPFAKDDHQFFNADYYKVKNCCWLIRQSDFDTFETENLIISLFEEKADYFVKKENLEKISNQNTWNNVNKKLIDLINEN